MPKPQLPHRRKKAGRPVNPFSRRSLQALARKKPGGQRLPEPSYVLTVSIRAPDYPVLAAFSDRPTKGIRIIISALARDRDLVAAVKSSIAKRDKRGYTTPEIDREVSRVESRISAMAMALPRTGK